jgi:hypothetical protein
MIATLNEIKRIIGISIGDTSKDTDIKTFMEICEAEIHYICKNDFIRNIDLKEEKYYGADTISFEESSNKILDSDNSLDTPFIVGNTIKVFNSLENDGIYLIDTIAGDGSYLTIDSDYGSLTDESAGQSISIYKLWYAKPLKFSIANMINFRLSKDSLKQAKGIESEKVDDYSVKFSSNASKLFGYPEEIISSLTNFRKYY